MIRRWIMLIAAVMALQTGCGPVDAAQLGELGSSAAVITHSGTQAAQADAAVSGASPKASVQRQASPKGKSMDRAAIEQLVKTDLARFLGVAAKTITVSEAVERTWPDRGLGCIPDRRFREPAPTPGYLIKLLHNGKTYAYHTDKTGRFMRCVFDPKKFGPITR